MSKVKDSIKTKEENIWTEECEALLAEWSILNLNPICFNI